MWQLLGTREVRGLLLGLFFVVGSPLAGIAALLAGGAVVVDRDELRTADEATLAAELRQTCDGLRKRAQ